MNRPLLRLNHPNLKSYFIYTQENGFSDKWSTRHRERQILHKLSSGSAYVLEGLLAVNKSKSLQRKDFWTNPGNMFSPYPSTDFNWGVVYG